MPAVRAIRLRSWSALGVVARAAGGGDGEAAVAVALGVGAAEGGGAGGGWAAARGGGGAGLVADGMEEGVGAATSPSCSRLLLWMLTHPPGGHWPPWKISTFASPRPKRFRTRW